MLSLGPGSACDVCLDPFNAELKAPCSIPCGHIFCVNCLQQLAHPTCPLCRTTFQARHTIRLHIDLDSIRAHPYTDEMPIPTNSDERARQMQQRITDLANGGATEIQTIQITEECKAFLATVPRDTYSTLRTAYRMLCYLCQVKRNYVNQGQTVNELTRNNTRLSQEVDRLKAAIEALKIEKRRLEQAWQTVSAEKDDISLECGKLHEQLDTAEAQMLLVTEQNETAQNQLVLLNEELQRLRSEGEFSSPEGDSPADILDFPTKLPPSIASDAQWQPTTLNLDSDSENQDPAAPFLTPWGVFTEFKGLPDADLPDDPEPTSAYCARPNGAYCGAAGCPHSCDCMPFQLFSPGSREAAAASGARNTSGGSPMATSELFAPAAPSGLYLSLNQDRGRSRSPSRPRSRSLSRAPSPSNVVNLDVPPPGPMPSMSSSINIPPNPHHELRGQLKDLLRDPPMSSSLPNMAHSHFPSSPLSREFRYGASSPMHPAPSKDRSVPIAPLGRPRDTHLHPPMSVHSRQPSPRHTSSPLSDPSSSQRPPLSRTSSSTSTSAHAAHAVDEKQAKEQRRADRLGVPRSSPLLGVPVLRQPAQSSSSTPPGPGFQTSSPAHTTGMARPQAPAVPSLHLPSAAMPAASSPRPQSHAHGIPHPSPPLPSTPSTQRPKPEPMPRAQAHGGTFTSSSPPASHTQHPSQPMLRAQAHVPPQPSPTTPATSAPRTNPKPPSPPSQTAYPPVLPPSVSVNSGATYGMPPPSRYATEGSPRVRRSEPVDAHSRGGYGGATASRGTSRRAGLAPAMATQMLYA